MEDRLLQHAPRLMDDGGWQVGNMILDDITSETELYLSMFRWAQVSGQKEYAFWKLAELWWSPGAVVDKLVLEANPWTAKIIRTLAEERFVAIGGSANSTKSMSIAAWGIVNWICDPENVMVLFTSTSITDSKRRVWKAVDTLLTPLINAKLAPTRIRANGTAPLNRADGTIYEGAGIFLIAGAAGKDREATSKLIGIKASPEIQNLPDGNIVVRPRLIVGADELSELSPAVVEALNNLRSQQPQFIGASNPSTKHNPFGEISEPVGGWDSVDLLEDDEWRTKAGGKFIRFDGMKSPNVLARETLYSYLPTLESIKEAADVYGEKSIGFMRFIRATFFSAAACEGTYNLPELRQAEALAEQERKPVWRERTLAYLAGSDPSESNAGDNFPLSFAKVGYLDDGRPAIEFLDTVYLRSDDTITTVPRTFQIAKLIKEECESRGIPPENFTIDDTLGQWADVLTHVWGTGIWAVNSNGRATDRPLQGGKAKPGETNEDHYVNRTAEMWWAPKVLLPNKQLFGVSKIAAEQMSARGFQYGKGGVGLKVGIEPKKDYRARVGSSPDEADTLFLLIDLAIERFGLLPTAAKSEKDAARLPDQRYSDFGWLEQMIQNPMCTISSSGAGWAD